LDKKKGTTPAKCKARLKTCKNAIVGIPRNGAVEKQNIENMPNRKKSCGYHIIAKADE
jgi:hypothetical protein